MDKLFEKYRKRLIGIGIVKSTIIALIVSLFSMGITSIVAWSFDTNTQILLISTFGVGVGAFIISLVLVYFIMFRPNDKTVAKQLDSLGYDERYITMYENKDNNSTIANIQRQDATNKLNNISEKRLKFNIALPVLILLAFAFVFASGTTTASLILNSNLIVENQNPPEQKQYFTVTYLVYEKDTGSIDGESVQRVEKGMYTKQVTAVASSGYKFVAWVDADKNYLSNQNNPRVEFNVQNDMTIYALFIKNDDNSDNDVNKGDKGDGGDNPDINQGGEGDGGDNSGSESGKGDISSGGKDGESRQDNTVIDGKQDYKDNFDRKTLEDELLNSDLPDDLKDILGDYYGTLAP